MDKDLYKIDCFGDPKLYNKPVKDIQVSNKYINYFL